ncbi:histidine ammonia-lyase [Oceanithermus desulfurans]|uniref:Histidine ammonia-lyase n=2 Tax=Oceanithermus desulfurans TaxID=227924 RepID=A0A511RKU3_9DEIN|nr:histidine ammonia-lyase [Oceanithermus desulfurans]MBB6029618.1 histidine ammonia-lyase [Oceanithermus desulfurans]GEM89687.1 histidine ammonia-lyase [Oceanithermus desulfurans NBRC 100063]
MPELDAAPTLDQIVTTARAGLAWTLSAAARARMQASRDVVERALASGAVVYGVTTGFGKFARVRIEPAAVRELQRNLLLSHAIGVGEPFPAEVVRAMMLLRAASLARGYSGVRPLVVQRLLALLAAGAHPVVPSQGSVGASGDLAPLAHMALPLIGEGEVELAGEVLPGAEALARLGLEPLVLEAKEGLALVNGTQAMSAVLVLLLHDARVLARTADVAAAMSVEALKASHRPFDAWVTRLRPHAGAEAVAANLRRLLADSQIAASHADCDKVQDAYSLRAVPQVHGASRDALAYLERALLVEVASVTDNPLVVPETGEVISAGNFHGQPLALPADAVAVALAELADVAERRVEQMLNPALSGLPAFLAERGGLHSGLMISQYTAASLVSENKVLAHPASVDSIPTSANQEDHVSMGTTAARQARMIYENALWVLAIELASAAQALDFHRPLEPGRGVRAAYARIRAEVPHLDRDRYLKPELARLRELIRSGELLRVVEAAVGPLA